MICFRDQTYCPFWEDCADAGGCPRPLTASVREAARRWWGGPEAPIAVFGERPECWREMPRGEEA